MLRAAIVAMKGEKFDVRDMPSIRAARRTLGRMARNGELSRHGVVYAGGSSYTVYREAKLLPLPTPEPAPVQNVPEWQKAWPRLRWVTR